MKKILALVLVVVAVFSLCACGATTEAPATETPATETPATR